MLISFGSCAVNCASYARTSSEPVVTLDESRGEARGGSSTQDGVYEPMGGSLTRGVAVEDAGPRRAASNSGMVVNRGGQQKSEGVLERWAVGNDAG